ncbi:hypothetical protein BGW38_000123 [Lunasporangiospora selenospora]|uniref:RRM domain-containing protein n=1 Tax=Lunasporangiospora selenospora TaxID=979761 RepID=A0A9P6KF18_9FUNG|nr:hypothetical protein BGW38_000123 [Lunasporangiospora selenospora]
MASTAPTIDPNQTIYVRNLNEKVKKDELKRSLYCLFSAYGKVISIVACKTQRDRGQAFIAFSDIVSATMALRGLQGFSFYGKSLEIQYAKTKSHAIAKLEGIVPEQSSHSVQIAANKRTRNDDDEDDEDDDDE